jgi:hypothetical protein
LGESLEITMSRSQGPFNGKWFFSVLLVWLSRPSELFNFLIGYPPTVLRIRVFIPDPNFFPSWIPNQHQTEFKYFNPKNCDPGCPSRIRVFAHLGSRGQKGTGPGSATLPAHRIFFYFSMWHLKPTLIVFFYGSRAV